MSVVDAIGLVLLLAAALVALPALVFFLEIAAAVARGRRDIAAPPAAPSQENLAVLMPAHDEALGIAAAIKAVMSQLGPRDRLLVVADNCSDATAAVSREAGAEVVERADASRRGKGYALDFGVRWLAQSPPGAVVIVDADCIVAAGALERLAATCLATRRPVQALYLMHAPAGAGLGLRIAEFAWVIKNHLRPLGAGALGWPCQLMGTGMGFPWSLIAGAPLASGHLVEDMELGAALARGGAAPLFCPQALVTSVFPQDAAAARAQRTRWEHGHLSVIVSKGPRLIAQSFVRRDGALAGMALDLIVPPLAALALALVATFALGAAWWAVAGAAGPVTVSALALACFASGVMMAWWRGGRHLVSMGELLALPVYVAAKIPLYVRLFTKRQIEWVRTKRDDRPH